MRSKTLYAVWIASFAAGAQADVVTDWNQRAGELVAEARLGTPPANRAMALVQTAVYEAVQRAGTSEPAALAAAVAAANRTVLLKLLPAQEAAIETAYRTALASVGSGPALEAGSSAGAAAAAQVLAARSDDNVAVPDTWRVRTSPGVYVPTSAVAAPQWPARKPWLMASPSQFRPAAPPALSSERWARDYNEIKALGGKASTRRSAEQTEAARFWEYSLPPIYYGVVRSVALQPGRDALRNARLYAAVAQGMDDAMIAVFDAKYRYDFWRPLTAIRNADIDGNDATEPEAGWAPMIDTPMHPEYPSAHSILASTVASVLQADVGAGALPELSTSSPTAKGATRRWADVESFVREVADARIHEGVHFRFSTEVGAAMGRQVGALAAERHYGTAPMPQALVPAGSHLQERIAARGVQIYECRSQGEAAEWTFVAPAAELLDEGGAPIGRHYGGPHWEANDGSRIVGRVEARADAPQADAIPWLLLSARSVGGSGRFAGVMHVQRVNTRGGSAPAQGCGPATLGATQRVPYSADYLLYAS